VQPLKSWGNHDALDRSVPDDHVLATALDILAGGHDVALVSDDTVPAMKAGTLGLQVVEPPEEHRLSPTADESEQKLRKANAELQAMKNARPKVTCAFEGGGREVELNADDFDEASPDIAEMVRKEGLRVKEKEFQGPSHSEVMDTEVARALAQVKRFTGSTLADVGQFNQDRARYLERYAEHLQELAEWALVARQFHLFTVVLANEGQVAADDVDVLLSTKGCVFRDPADFPDRPKAPRPPGPDRYEPAFIAASLYDGHRVSAQAPAVPTSKVRQDGVWHGHIPPLKQGLAHEFEVLIERPARAWVTPAEIGFNIVCANGFGDTKGNLRVKFRRGPPPPASGET